jgi:hypothetical protein
MSVALGFAALIADLKCDFGAFYAVNWFDTASSPDTPLNPDPRGRVPVIRALGKIPY